MRALDKFLRLCFLSITIPAAVPFPLHGGEKPPAEEFVGDVINTSHTNQQILDLYIPHLLELIEPYRNSKFAARGRTYSYSRWSLRFYEDFSISVNIGLEVRQNSVGFWCMIDNSDRTLFALSISILSNDGHTWESPFIVFHGMEELIPGIPLSELRDIKNKSIEGLRNAAKDT